MTQKGNKVNCAECRAVFSRSLRQIKENRKLGHNFFCSARCQYNYRNTKQNLICENSSCRNVFFRNLSQFSSSNYCSRSCAAKLNNKKFPKRIAETFICRRCWNIFKRKKVRTIYCSKNCYTQAQLKFSRDQIIGLISKKAAELSRVPAKRELIDCAKSAVSIFGSWNGAVRAAGFEPYRSHDDRMYKRSRTKALDGHKCDSISEAIIDNWFYKNGIPHLRDAAYPTGKFKSDWSLENGKIFVEYFGLAEDSKRYDLTVRTKRAMCRSRGIKLVPIFAGDLYPKSVFAEKLRNIL